MNFKQGDLENTILNAVWNMEENDQELVDVSEVQNKINVNRQKWAYTTVKTVLDRLVEKGLVTRLKQGKKYFYKSTVSRLESGDQAIKKLAKQYYNGDVEELLKAAERIHSYAVVYAR